MTTAATDAAQRLRFAGLRVTAPRIAVLEQVAQQPHADVDAIVRGVRARLGSVSTQAVYDVLRALGLAGLVRRIEPAGSPARFETRAGDNHHHVVCRSCGAVADVDCALGPAPCLDPSERTGAAAGFLVDEAEVTFWGLCPACQAKSSEPPHGSTAGETAPDDVPVPSARPTARPSREGAGA